MLIPIIIAVVVTLIVVMPVTYFVTVSKLKNDANSKIGNADVKAREIIDDALKTAETKKKEALLEVKEESLRTKNELEKETKERRAEIQKYEKRVLSKEETLDRKIDAVEKRDLSITRKEAAAYIEKYFETYPKIKGFLDGLVKEGREHGYVTTMFGRRRPVPELKSSNFMQRQFGERVAMNSPIQGTAADIMKIAMIAVDKELRMRNMKSRLVLQVHDELLIETWKEEEEEVREILKEGMMHAADLSVPLEIDMHSGKNWYEAK